MKICVKRLFNNSCSHLMYFSTVQHVTKTRNRWEFPSRAVKSTRKFPLVSHKLTQIRLKPNRNLYFIHSLCILVYFSVFCSRGPYSYLRCPALAMGGAAGTAGTAAAVPLLREVQQDKVLPCHILVKKNSQTYRRFSLVNLTKFGPYVMAKRFFFS